MTHKLLCFAIALALIECSSPAVEQPSDPEGTGEEPDGSTALPACTVADEGQYTIYVLPAPEREDGTVEASWVRADGVFVELLVDGVSERVAVGVDASSLDALLEEGDPVRVTQWTASTTLAELRIARADGTLLLSSIRVSASHEALTLPSIEGFDATLAILPTCEHLHTYSQFCDPAVLRVGSIAVTAGEQAVVADPRMTVDVATESGTFRVHNLVVTEASHASEQSCAIALVSHAQLGVVRVE